MTMRPNVRINGGTSSADYNNDENQLRMSNNLMHNNNISHENPNEVKSYTNFSAGASPSSLHNLMNFADSMQFSDDEDIVRGSDKAEAPIEQLQLLGENDVQESGEAVENNKNKSNGNKRKRPRTIKSSEEVESQRMIHIAVERNRRKQMNEHLNVLKSLMPRSYVQRGDQASIIGGAIEFVKELEQLLQCLESQKRRRLYGDDECPKLSNIGESSNTIQQQSQHQLSTPQSLLPVAPVAADDQLKFDLDYESFQRLHEETAESKSFLADVQVKLLGLDNAMIKILSRRRHGQLINTIAALEEMQLNILQTNVTTIEQTVLYSFHVKIEGEVRYTAEDIANFVQQTLGFIHVNATNVC